MLRFCTLSLMLVAVDLAALASADELPQDKFTNSLGMMMVPIERGTFVMGDGEGRPRSREEWQKRDWDESPAHRVNISQRFFMSTHEITNSQYEKFDPKHKELRGKLRGSSGNDEPVTMVSWNDAIEFCEWLSKQEGRNYRLPTEAEWEYACRAGTTTNFNTGEKLTHALANIGLSADGNSQRYSTTAVGSFDANDWGLFDMHGNVAEWCNDWYGKYLGEEQTDPVGPTGGESRVVRGGSFAVASWRDSSAKYCRSANRSGLVPDEANRMTGFRVVLGPHPTGRPVVANYPPPSEYEISHEPAPRNGPPAEKPYFDDFRDRRPTIEANTWGPIFSSWNHFTACCVCPNGDVLSAWYTTVSEAGRELAQASARLPTGTDTWTAAAPFFDVADMNDHAPVLLCDGKRIYHFASQSLRGWDDTSIVLRISDNNGKTWSHPRIISRREGPNNLSQSCSAFVAKDGTIYVAVDGDGHRNIGLLASKDRGDSWELAGTLPELVNGKRAIHPAVTQMDDGRFVAFLRGPDPVPRLVSEDDGKTWEQHDTPFGGIGVGSKAAVLQLADGKLLLAGADTARPPITGNRGTFAALSSDGGETWGHIRALPNVGGYVSAAQAPNGVIYVFGSRLSAVAFNTAWLKEGPAVDDK